MFRKIATVAVAAATVAASITEVHGQTPKTQAAGTKKHLALVGGMLIDGYEVPPVHHAAIVIEDDKISIFACGIKLIRHIRKIDHRLASPGSDELDRQISERRLHLKNSRPPFADVASPKSRWPPFSD